MTLWHGRLGADTADAVMAYTVSLEVDRALAADDLAGSRAHVRGLRRAGLVSPEEEGAVLRALDQVAEELGSGAFEFQPADEDIHTAVERRVTELAGEAGAKLHTGRSRNDQVATDLRLFTKRSLREVATEVLALEEELLRRAKEVGDTYLPGYTHLQRAQPVLLAHHLLAHGWALARDVDRMAATVERADVSPLGAGALAGSSLPLDPDSVARELGFARRFENSLDAVSDRDFVAEALFDLALLAVHLSRLGEEVVLWSSEEFGFVVLDDAFATGSSMLPQKKNPDVAELARGKAGRLIGNLTGLLATLKGLPLAYNRDLQEDKEPLFDSLRQTRLGLAAVRGLVATMHFDAARMQRAADEAAVAAVDLAEWLVERGMAFRQAHQLVAGLVHESVDRHVPLAELVEAHPSLGAEARALLEPGVAVTRRATPGSAGPAAVAVQLDR
ncbi:MAG TPA: argininosuccinate lyase, partial [Acidimicrobiales bacterium]|nr:argininosuccinate lyase [Acidimicrobiales bacterium]